MRLIKLKAMKRINGLHFTPDGRRLLVVGGKFTRRADEARWIDVSAMKELLRVPLYTVSYALSPDLTRIAVGSLPAFTEWDSQRPELVVFDPTNSTWHEDESRWQVVSLNGGRWVTGLEFAPDGDRLAIGFSVAGAGRDVFHARLAITSLKTSQTTPFAWGEYDPLGAITFSPDGSTFAAFNWYTPHTATIFSVDAAAPLFTFSPPGDITRRLLYSPEGSSLAVANARTVYLLPADSDVPRFTLPHPKQVNATAYPPYGRRLLSTCHDGPVRIWETPTGQLVTSYDWGIGQTTAIAVSPDGLTAAVAGQKGQIALFDLDG